MDSQFVLEAMMRMLQFFWLGKGLILMQASLDKVNIVSISPGCSLPATLWFSCCPVCERQGLQACKRLLRPEGSCRSCILGRIHAQSPLVLLHAPLI